MESNIDNNIIILSIVAIILIYIAIVIIRDKMRSGVSSKSTFDTLDGGSVVKEQVAIKPKRKSPKLPKNETLYQIVKNDTLVSNVIPFDMYYILDELVSLMRTEMRSDSVELLFDIDPDVPMQLIGSPKRLSRVLVNLLSNSIKATQNGSVVLRIEMLKSSARDCQLLFGIRDRGVGMNSEEIKDLFTDPMNRRGEHSDALGFFVANALVKEQGGNIEIESTPGKGTLAKFDMSFLLSPKEIEVDYVPSKECKSIRVAVIERLDEVSKLYKKQLQPYVKKIDIISVSGDSVKLEALDGFDLIICDYWVVDGVLIDHAKQSGAYIVISQNIFSHSAIDKTILFSTDYLITKPFTSQHIVEMLSVLYGSSVTASLEVVDGFMGKSVASSASLRAEGFVSDSQIPVVDSVSKKDFIRFVGSKILVVEDNPINQRVIGGLLGDSGISLHFAEDGLEALEILEDKAPFDLILMDINMPVLDGFETTERIRENSRYDNMPIVAFTGINLQDQIDRMREVGMDAHMAKPLNIGRFYSVFLHFLPKHSTQ